MSYSNYPNQPPGQFPGYPTPGQQQPYNPYQQQQQLPYPPPQGPPPPLLSPHGQPPSSVPYQTYQPYPPAYQQIYPDYNQYPPSNANAPPGYPGTQPQSQTQPQVGPPPPGYPQTQNQAPPAVSPPENPQLQNQPQSATPQSTSAASQAHDTLPTPSSSPSELRGYFHISSVSASGLSKDGKCYLLIALLEAGRLSKKNRIAVRSKEKASGGKVEFHLKSKQAKIPVNGKFFSMNIDITHDGMMSNAVLGRVSIGLDKNKAPFIKPLKGSYPMSLGSAKIDIDLHFESDTKAKNFSSTSSSN